MELIQFAYENAPWILFLMGALLAFDLWLLWQLRTRRYYDNESGRYRRCFVFGDAGLLELVFSVMAYLLLYWMYDDNAILIFLVVYPVLAFYVNVGVENAKMSGKQNKNISAKEDVVRCPLCGSTQLSANRKGFGVGKAAAGGLVLGPVGLLGGFIGSSKIKITCLKCGHQWKP